ncbi:MAG: bifunctional phosphopantothenoylcysteine decarboxylase/phosphopantothenate--cysteine ligase CoaBC [Proteobacteria bacterium]|jgi:phosphopantothenoylcysteine decarboxylase / phosphopantothenate---cysteine ligase|nr:bifunctional phosphopantothenoylcysteine decarboxylase/phosphopantothenate--cysteine ligase CoaBC [Pseudomonadota bacterium]
MGCLQNKQILVGVSGGIAAYKTPELVRRLRDRGAEVRVIMTSAAESFITSLSLQAVSGHPVHVAEMSADSESGMGHIDLARWADLILIAPTTANTMARLANGFGDELLTTVCLATSAPIALAPAMNQQMWSNAATQANLEKVKSIGMEVFGPGIGDQACGETGPGRMLEPDDLVACCEQLLTSLRQDGPLRGKHCLITAGPTVEHLDPVRAITNFSSGRMGYAIAAAANAAGADVTLVSGPVAIEAPANVTRISVKSAEEMRTAVLSKVADSDIFIGVAAVADYRPKSQATKKFKKNDDSMTVELVKNPDILSEVSAHKDRPFVVGFAAETDDLEKNALAKLKKKKLDMIAANKVGGSDSGFGDNPNALIVLTANGGRHELPMSDKNQLAQSLIALIGNNLPA